MSWYTEMPKRVQRWVEDARSDIRYALHQHRRTPGVAVLIVLTLAVGIGANVTMVGAIDQLLFRAPPYIRNPERVIRILILAPNPRGGVSVTASSNYPTFLDLQRDVTHFETTAAYSSGTVSIGEGPSAIRARASLVSSGFFAVFHVRALIGRLFSQVDDRSADVPIAVLSYGFWKRAFAGDSTIVGRTVLIDDLAYTIIGVAPNGFRAVESKAPDLWLPIGLAAIRTAKIPLSLSDRGSLWLSIVARLAPGASLSMVEREATNVWRQYNARPDGPARTTRLVAASVIPGRGADRPREVNIALWLGGVSTLVLLIACANVANLLLARGVSRQREIAVRLALGARQGRLARQLLTENLLLAGLGGVSALFLGLFMSRFLQGQFMTDDAPRSLVDVRLFLITAAIVIGTGVLISLAPLAQSLAPDLTTALRAGMLASGARTSRVRTALVGTQAALCMVMLIGAALFAESFRNVGGLDLGMDLEHTVMATVDFGSVSLPVTETEAMYQAISQKVRAIPGVSRTALAEKDPYLFGRAVPAHSVKRSAQSLWREGTVQVPMEADVDSSFFHAVGATSLRGRDFESGDRRGSPRVAIINEPLAELLWPGEEPLGKCMLVSWNGGDCVTVVGVLKGFWKQSILQRDRLVVYFPMAQSEWFVPAGSMFIHVTRDPSKTADAIRAAIQSVRPDMPAVSVSLMKDIVDSELRPWRLAAIMFGVFGVVALVIAVIGLFGVVAFTATERSAEIAIRIVLGAPLKHVLLVIARDALIAVVVGLLVGIGVGIGASQWIGPLLFETSPTDPRIFVGVSAILLSVAIVASVVPTVRAVRRNPAVILRVE